MLSQKEIYKAVVTALQQEFAKPLPIYSDEVLDGFQKPCLFIKFNRTTTPSSVNFSKQKLFVVITYFTNKANEVEYFEVLDKVAHAFRLGFYAGDRFLKVRSIQDDRIGDKQDILQVRVSIEYLDKLDREHSTDMMESVEVVMEHRKEVFR